VYNASRFRSKDWDVGLIPRAARAARLVFGETLRLSSAFTFQTLRIFLAVLVALCSCAIHSPAAAAQQEDTSLSAEVIIQILQENPDILAESKSQIVAALRERGLPVTESDITDERLFSQIRSDDRVRLLMSD
jgi:hypothetical protein